MVKIKQNNVQIGDKTLIEIKCNKLKYYPIAHTYKNILLKSRQSASKLIKDGYDVKQFDVDFGYSIGGVQKSQCISKEGFMDLLKKSNVGGFDVEQKKGMNLLLDYFNMELINEYPRFLDYFDYINSDKYDEFEKDCIEETLKLDKDLKFQRCNHCEKYYPIHTNFFRLNTRDKVYQTICNNCIINDGEQHFKHPVYEVKSIDELKSIEKLKSKIPSFDKNYDVIGIYKNYLNSDKTHFPEKIKNKDDYKIILRYLEDNGQINKDELNNEYLVNIHKLKGISAHIKLHEIYELLFGNHPKEHPWQYKKYRLLKLSMDAAKVIFNNYLKENNINIKDVYNFNYSEIIIKARLRQFEKDILKFIMEYHDNKYPAYKFNIASVNYWKEKEHRNRALKYLIEEDMKLELGKIPLYLTITSVKNVGTTTMYNVLKNYYSGLFEWVNEVYPDVFDPKDFDINYMRNEFDSIDENTIDDILRDNFDNVLYNPKHTKNTIKLLGKIPDWFIFNTTGVVIVEYFGLWAKKRGMYNSRTRDYIISAKDKINKYKTLQGYKFLYIYPEDLDNNYEGLHKKIDEIKNDKFLMKTV